MCIKSSELNRISRISRVACIIKYVIGLTVHTRRDGTFALSALLNLSLKKKKAAVAVSSDYHRCRHRYQPYISEHCY